MELKSISECINIINLAMNGFIIDCLDLENVRKYLNEQEQSDIKQGKFGLSEVLKQLISIIENCNQLGEKNKKIEYAQLTKLKLNWLLNRNIESEIDNQQ